MFATSAIELSAGALHNNLRFIRKRLKPEVRLCSVVKGNAYGHGVTEFVNMAMKEGLRYFAVHSAEEAFQLHSTLTELPDIFIMSAIEDEGIEWAILNGIEFAAFDFQRLETSLFYARRHKKKAKIHIEVETGMQRTGFNLAQITGICDYLKAHEDALIFQGLFTHYAGAESQANDFRVKEQIELYQLAVQAFAIQQLHPIYQHSACSAALLNYPATQGNMVRIGILQYGFWPNLETKTRHMGDKDSNLDPLKRIIRWTSKVMATSEAHKGSFVGYGTGFFAHKNMKLAIIPVGYAHGYSRSLSNIGTVLIGGKQAPVVGVVNMNSITVDISKHALVKKGDEVVIIGKQKEKTISVNSFSEQSQLLNYELLTRLPNNIARRIAP